MQRITSCLSLLAALALSGNGMAQLPALHVFQVSLDGKQAVPANNSNGIGKITVQLNSGNGQVIVDGIYSGLLGNRTNQHIHAAAAGSNGPVVLALTGSGAKSGSIGPASGTLSAAQRATMLAGGMYINIHSASIPGGEIRGQIIPDPLYYKFDRGIGDVATNYGSFQLPPAKFAKAPATLNPWAPGRAGFGGSIRGTRNTTSGEYNYCDTGWKDGMKGDLTVSWWMKQRVAPGTALSYTWGGIGSWRCFTNGVAGTGLWMRSWGGPDLKYPGNVQTLAARAQGVCVALTVNSKTLRAQWYTDGVATGAPIVVPNGLNVAASASSFKIGKHTSNSTSSAYDLDEFRLSNRVASAAEIRAWCSRPSAASGVIDIPCGMGHVTTGGPPSLGNANFTMTAFSPRNQNLRYLFVAGARRVPPFDMRLVFGGLPASCPWYPSFDVQIVGSVPTGGYLAIRAPIPSSVSLAGVKVDTQVLGFLPTQVRVSNPLSHAIER